MWGRRSARSFSDQLLNFEFQLWRRLSPLVFKITNNHLLDWTLFLGLANSCYFNCNKKKKRKNAIWRKEVMSKTAITCESPSLRIVEFQMSQLHMSGVSDYACWFSPKCALNVQKMSFRSSCYNSLAHSYFSSIYLLKSQRHVPDSWIYHGEKRTGQFSLQAKPPSGILDSKMPWVFPASHGPQVWKSTGLSFKQGISLKPCL